MEALLRISVVQTDIVWEDKQTNLRYLCEKLEQLSGTTDLVVLPEMFSTGFSMESRLLAEPVSGDTITTLKKQASYHRFAIAGSYIAMENDAYYNRGFFLTPEGEAFFYDKHHLFRLGKEYEHFSTGNRKVIIPYREWNICIMICYDLRFPVWSRNVNNEYDLLIYVANWPSIICSKKFNKKA
ncbi:(R)-stereoselective amidase [termite gut metagenome]|uniref:(R)-stereoselective amidase n=1 Tax=termite gut metagenome TaxID=433724 RepID=A0A5J4PZK9_9ZZZZ